MTLPPSLILPQLARPAFFDGQQLAAADLQAVHEYHREVRWLHNRTLHNWGIAVGLTVTGAKGAREVTVAPGYGIDCNGRDLVLSRPATLAVPVVAGTTGPVPYFLTASYLPDEELRSEERRNGVCAGSGAVRRMEEPRLRWQRPMDQAPESRYRRGLDLILGTVSVDGCVLAAAVSTQDRRYALMETRPLVASGATVEGETNWAFFPAAGTPTGVETVVDTTSAGFGRTPLYLAQVIGSRTHGAQNRIFDGFSSVLSPSSSGFTLRMAMPRNLSVPPYTVNPNAAFTSALLPLLRDTLRWSVMWLGIEG